MTVQNLAGPSVKLTMDSLLNMNVIWDLVRSIARDTSVNGMNAAMHVKMWVERGMVEGVDNGLSMLRPSTEERPVKCKK
jgi:hypothetical protein